MRKMNCRILTRLFFALILILGVIGFFAMFGNEAVKPIKFCKSPPAKVGVHV